MTDISTQVSPVSQVDSLHNRDRFAQEDSQRAFLDVLDQGLDRLSQRPDLTTQADRVVENLTGKYAGNVGHAMSEIVGGEAARIDRSTEAANLSLEDRVKSLYSELTHYQVAWRIAQNVQRDVSQVLRGN